MEDIFNSLNLLILIHLIYSVKFDIIKGAAHFQQTRLEVNYKLDNYAK